MTSSLPPLLAALFLTTAAYSATDSTPSAPPPNFAQKTGSFQRPSVSVLQSLWAMDQSILRMPYEVSVGISSSLNSELQLQRFDVNALPPGIETRFRTTSRAFLDQGESSISKAINMALDSTLLPAIQVAIEKDLQSRAAGSLNEVQLNSWATDKAKLDGVTGEEVDRVRNAAFVILPFAQDYALSRSGNTSIASMTVGVMVYKIHRDSAGTASIKLLREVRTRSTGMGSGNLGSPTGKAQSALVDNASRNIQTLIKGLPEFSLGARILDKSWYGVGFDIGKREGVDIDDRFAVIEERLMPDGRTVQRDVGWVIAQDIGTREGKPYTRAVRGGGDVDIGMALREDPALGLDIGFGARSFGARFENDSLDWNTPFGVMLSTRSNIGRGLGLSQFFLTAELGFAVGNAEDKRKFLRPYGDDGSYAASAGVIGLGLLKKWWLAPRLGLYGEAGLSLQAHSLSDDEGSQVNSFGAHTGAGLDLNLSRSWILSGGIRASTLATGAWDSEDKLARPYGDLTPDPLEIHGSLRWQPGELGFDPLNVFRTLMGL